MADAPFERGIVCTAKAVRDLCRRKKVRLEVPVKDARGAFWDHAGWTPVLEKTGAGIDFWRAESDGAVAHHTAPKTKSPFGPVGARLWVRETWAPRLKFEHKRGKLIISDDPNPRYVKYRADNNEASPSDPLDWHTWPETWRSSTQMPRWASRVTLEVTRVRLKRRGGTWPPAWLWVYDTVVVP